MAEEGHQSRFVCTLCNKNYPCGKSLGGHMRSHVIANSAESDHRFDVKKPKKISPFGEQSSIIMTTESKPNYESGNGGYVLRENPKKTWRAVDSTIPPPSERICKQCGKGFQSLKALCGHMACHSEKDKGFKDDNSWTSESQKLVMDSHSDTEAADRMRLRTRSSSKSKKKVSEDSPFSIGNNYGSSSVSEMTDHGQEHEEVAMCLMMLSRDSVNKGGGVNSVVVSSDNNSVVLETKSSSIEMKMGKTESLNRVCRQDEIPNVKKIGCGKLKDGGLDDQIAQIENSDSGYFLDECAKADESDGSVDGFRRYGALGESKKVIIKNCRTELAKLSKGNLYNDNGMASNLRKRKYGSENPESWNESKKIMIGNGENSRKKSKYECFNCKKTFKSFQALGGHRPCHKRCNYEYTHESGENSLNDSTVYRTTGNLIESSSNGISRAKISSHYAEKKLIKPKKGKGHVCPFCDRVFKNGQALGGHKRSHFIGGNHEENNNIRTSVVKNERPDFFDLNLPAPEEDEDWL